VPFGIANPWGLLSSVSLFLLLIFFVDATIIVWRRGDRRRALFVGGSMIFGAILAWHVPLVIWGIIEVPFFLCFTYSGIIAAMAYELSNDMAQAAHVARQLQASEVNLRESQERMELAASAAELGMWMWDIVRDEIWITDKGRALFGLAPSEKVDFNRFRNMLHPEDRESVLKALETSLRTGVEYRAEYRAVLPNGQIRWIWGRGHVEFNGEGQPIRMRGASLDVTQRKQAEEQLEMTEATLRESKERIDLATKAAGLVVWTWDIPRDEVWLSNKDRALFGFSQAEKLTAERIRSVIHPEDRQLVRQLSEDALRTDREIETQYRVLLPDGKVRWVTRRGRVEFGADGKPLRERGVLMDISERKYAELQAQQQRDELEQLRQQRTASLEREVSERTRLEREVIDICAREQRRIAYDLHDGLGQQLVGIALCAKLLEEQLRGERPSEADKAGMIVKLVNDAARQARLTARTLEGADGVGDLKTALHSLAISVSRTCSVKATVTAEGSSLPISPPVAAQLYRIAQEAVHNAVEHGGAGEVQINLASNQAVANGNGMGLRIMRYRAQCIGGSCDVQSSAEGTVVRCCVPLEPQLAAFGLP